MLFAMKAKESYGVISTEKPTQKAEALLISAICEVYTMNEQIKTYIEKYPGEVIDMFTSLRQLIYDSVSHVFEEKLWAKLPSFYVGEKFVRLIPFKDHINIEAQAITRYKEKLVDYKITPKGMLQIFANQNIPNDILLQIFTETLGE